MITEEQQHFMQMAVDLSQYSIDSNIGGPFGAIIVKNGNIIGSSGNCVYRDFDPSAHAEVMAIRDACRNLKSVDLSGCEIYCSSEPCPMCLAAIYWAQISSIFYCNSEREIFDKGYMDKSILQDLQKPKERRRIQSVQIPNNKALKIFERDTKSKNKPNVTIEE